MCDLFRPGGHQGHVVFRGPENQLEFDGSCLMGFRSATASVWPSRSPSTLRW